MASKDYRALARRVLRGKWLYMYGLMMLALLVSDRFSLDTIWKNFFFRPVSFLNTTLQIPSGFGWVLAALALACTVINYTVMIGRYAASQTLLSGETPALKQFFPMKYLWKALLMNIVMLILVALQLLLLIVPGVIALIAYSMAPYLLLENPDLGPIQALKESRRRMKGHKWEAVCLGFSFFGWILIPMVLGALAGNIGAGISPAAGALLQAASYVLLWPPLTIYMDVARTAFFHDVLYGTPKKKK